MRGIICVTPGRKGNWLSRRTTFRWASVTREEKKRLRAEQTEERVPRMKQEWVFLVNNFTQQTNHTIEDDKHNWCRFNNAGVDLGMGVSSCVIYLNLILFLPSWHCLTACGWWKSKWLTELLPKNVKNENVEQRRRTSSNISVWVLHSIYLTLA